jgi:ectoine hydroxylase-related dioxygenase (phytanoyl-CoA dioxygenase family)
LDHPAIVNILEEILGHNPTGDSYGFRCESSFATIRRAGLDNPQEAHGGGNNVSPLFSYQCKNGSIYSGLTRVVWELNEVEYGTGGTLLLSGSHKMNFPLPASMDKHSPLFETYACPPGSVLIFSEAVCHAGCSWTNTRHHRMAIFNCYSRIDTQYHKLSLPLEVIQAIPPRRRTLFRGVWDHDFQGRQPNNYFSPENMSL